MRWSIMIFPPPPGSVALEAGPSGDRQGLPFSPSKITTSLVGLLMILVVMMINIHQVWSEQCSQVCLLSPPSTWTTTLSTATAASHGWQHGWPPLAIQIISNNNNQQGQHGWQPLRRSIQTIESDQAKEPSAPLLDFSLDANWPIFLRVPWFALVATEIPSRRGKWLQFFFSVNVKANLSIKLYRCDPCFSSPCQHGGLCLKSSSLSRHLLSQFPPF